MQYRPFISTGLLQDTKSNITTAGGQFLKAESKGTLTTYMTNSAKPVVTHVEYAMIRKCRITEPVQRVDRCFDALYLWMRPVGYAVTFLSRYLHKPGVKHLKRAQEDGIHCIDLARLGLGIKSSTDFAAQIAGCCDTARSTSENVILMNAQAISWYSCQQTTVLCTAKDALAIHNCCEGEVYKSNSIWFTMQTSRTNVHRQYNCMGG